MKLDQLPKVITKSKKRIGRGTGSGRGKTSGRGMKGMKARGKVPVGFIGGTLPLYRKLPYRRGISKRHVNRKVSPNMLPVGLDVLSKLPANTEVTLESLIKNKLVDQGDAEKRGVKVVGDGDLLVALIVKLPTSKSAVEKIEKAGGKVVRG